MKVNIKTISDITGFSLHILNYNFNEGTHRLDPLKEMEFKLNFPASSVKMHTFPENDSASFKFEDKAILAKDLGIYTIFELN